MEKATSELNIQLQSLNEKYKFPVEFFGEYSNIILDTSMFLSKYHFFFYSPPSILVRNKPENAHAVNPNFIELGSFYGGMGTQIVLAFDHVMSKFYFLRLGGSNDLDRTRDLNFYTGTSSKHKFDPTKLDKKFIVEPCDVFTLIMYHPEKILPFSSCTDGAHHC